MISHEEPIKEQVPSTPEIVHRSNETITKNNDCSSADLYVGNSKVHGIGVFAKKSFLPDEVIEIFPIVPLAYRTMYQGDFRVVDYCVVRQCDCEECKRHGLVLFLRLGYGGIYNHQDSNNAQLIMDYPNSIGKCIATKQIQKNEEIFINYGLNYKFHEGKNILKAE